MYVVDTVTCWFDRDTDILLSGIVLGTEDLLGGLVELLRTERGFMWKVTVELLMHTRLSSKTWIDFFSFTLVILNVTFWKEAKKMKVLVWGLKTFKKKTGLYRIVSAHLKAVNRISYHLCNFKNFTLYFLICWKSFVESEQGSFLK